jgi:hypothetical protein
MISTQIEMSNVSLARKHHSPLHQGTAWVSMWHELVQDSVLSLWPSSEQLRRLSSQSQYVLPYIRIMCGYLNVTPGKLHVAFVSVQRLIEPRDHNHSEGVPVVLP